MGDYEQKAEKDIDMGDIDFAHTCGSVSVMDAV